MAILRWILLVVVAVIFSYFLPWWSVALAGFVYGLLFKQSPGRAFLGGFLAIFLLWGITAGYISWMNDGILAGRLASLFSLPQGGLAMMAAAIVGGLTGGVSAVTGKLLRNLLVNKNLPT